MARLNTKYRYMYDAAPATLFKARTAAAITATADSAEIVLAKAVGEWQGVAPEPATETLAVVINVTALDLSSLNETYTIAVKATNGAAGVLTTDLGTLTITKVGQYAVLVDVPTVLLCDPTFDGLILTATLGGTTPSLTYHAWATMIEGA